jgi:membrane protein DedA with SNARE-associated domain
MKKFFKLKKNYILANFTLAKLLAAAITALLVASLKYSISGSLHIEYNDFLNNVGIALLG